MQTTGVSLTLPGCYFPSSCQPVPTYVKLELKWGRGSFTPWNFVHPHPSHKAVVKKVSHQMVSFRAWLKIQLRANKKNDYVLPILTTFPWSNIKKFKLVLKLFFSPLIWAQTQCPSFIYLDASFDWVWKDQNSTSQKWQEKWKAECVTSVFTSHLCF